MAPAIRAASEGFAVDELAAEKVVATLVPNAARFPDTYRLYSIDGRPPQPGEVLRNSGSGRDLNPDCPGWGRRRLLR